MVDQQQGMMQHEYACNLSPRSFTARTAEATGTAAVRTPSTRPRARISSQTAKGTFAFEMEFRKATSWFPLQQVFDLSRVERVLPVLHGRERMRRPLAALAR